MQVSKVSFKGYVESATVLRNCPNGYIIKALDNARPYLMQIGNSMPASRDLVISVTDDGCDTFLSAYDYNNRNQKAKLLARGNEHNLTEYGLDFVEKVFKGLQNNNEKEFKDISADFVTKFHNIMWLQHPIKSICNKED